MGIGERARVRGNGGEGLVRRNGGVGISKHSAFNFLHLRIANVTGPGERA